MTKCDKQDCRFFEYPNSYIECASCSELIKESHYQKIIDPLKNLFDGAPVMVRNSKNADWKGRYYKSNSECYSSGKTLFSIGSSKTYEWEETRLPTIEESPRNVWLAAPTDEESQRELEQLRIMIWQADGHTPNFPAYQTKLNWNVIEKVMIISKEEF